MYYKPSLWGQGGWSDSLKEGQFYYEGKGDKMIFTSARGAKGGQDILKYVCQ